PWVTPRRLGAPPPPPAPLGEQAAEALGQMGPDAQAAVPALTEALKDPQLSAYRPYYALALVKIDRQSAKLAVPSLLQALAGKGPRAHLGQEAGSALRKEIATVLGS